MSRLAQLLLAAFLAAPAAAQASVHVVDLAGGAGASHTYIHEALAVAAEGDVVFVRAGDYPERVEVTGRGVALVAEAGALVRVLGLDVTDVPAGRVVLVRGFTPRVEGLLGILGGRAAEVARVAGPLWFEGCTFDSAPIAAGYGVSGGLRVEQSASVVLAHCRVARPYPSVAIPSLSAIEARSNARLHVLASEVTGMHTDAAVSVLGAELELTGSSVSAGDGSVCFPPGCCTPGADALELLPGALATLRDTQLVPGVGGGPACADGLPVRLAGGAAIDAPGGSAWLEVAGPYREGELATVRIHAEPGARAWLRHAPAPTPGSRHALIDGELLLASPVTTLGAGIVPASGVLELQAPAPQLSDAEAVRIYWLQALVRSSGRFQSSAPATLVLLDEAL